MQPDLVQISDNVQKRTPWGANRSFFTTRIWHKFNTIGSYQVAQTVQSRYREESSRCCPWVSERQTKRKCSGPFGGEDVPERPLGFVWMQSWGNWPPFECRKMDCMMCNDAQTTLQWPCNTLRPSKPIKTITARHNSGNCWLRTPRCQTISNKDSIRNQKPRHHLLSECQHWGSDHLLKTIQSTNGSPRNCCEASSCRQCLPISSSLLMEVPLKCHQLTANQGGYGQKPSKTFAAHQSEIKISIDI